MLSVYAKHEWLTILAIGGLLLVSLLIIGWWWLACAVGLAIAALLSFFRDPRRSIPFQRGIFVSPADGRVTSVHRVDHFEHFNEPAVCVRIFLSVFNVHINRAPCQGVVDSIHHRSGGHRNALDPRSAQTNESILMVLVHPVRGRPIAAVRQVAGLLARSIVCRVKERQVLQRGERYGMIKLGSTTELYLPESGNPQVLVKPGQCVRSGQSILANVQPQTTRGMGVSPMTDSTGGTPVPSRAPHDDSAKGESGMGSQPIDISKGSTEPPSS